MQRPRSIYKATGILIMGAVLVVAGVFLWQQPFFFNQNSSARGAKIDSIVVVGPKELTTFKSAFSSNIKSQYGTGVTIVTIPTSEEFTLETLRQQTAILVKELKQPIQNKVAFVIVLPPSIFQPSSHNGDFPAKIRQQVQDDLGSFITFLQNRPGVFPQGFSVYIAITATQESVIKNGVKCFGDLDISQISSITTTLETTYPGIVHTINTKSLSTNIVDCSLNSEGQSDLGNLAAKSIETFEQ